MAKSSLKDYSPAAPSTKAARPIAKLSADAGLPAAPVSPLGASSLPSPDGAGPTPDQIKMVGTKAQAKSTVSLGGTGETESPAAPLPAAETSGESPTSLVDAQRLRRSGGAPKQGMTPQEIEDRDRLAEARETVGHFGEMAEQLIQSFVPKANAPAAAAVANPLPQINAKAVTEAGLAGDNQFQTLLREVAMASKYDPGKTQDWIIAAQRQAAQHGIRLSPADIQGMTGFAPAAEAIPQAVEAALPDVDALTLSGDTLSRMGLTEKQAAALFPPGTDLSTKTVADIRGAVEGMGRRAEDPLATLQSQLSDPTLGVHERDAAAQELLARGGSLRANAQETAELADDIDDGLTVSIGEQDFTVEELLDGEETSSLIHRYLSEPADSPFRAELAKKLPDLAAWVDRHAVALSEAASVLEKTAAGMAEKQAKAGETLAGLKATGLSDDEIRDILGEEAFTALSDPFALSSADPKKLGGLAQALLNPAALDPGVLERLRAIPSDLRGDLGRLSAEDLARTGFLTGDENWTEFLALRNAHAVFDDASVPIEDRLKAVFGQDFSLANAQAALARAKVTGERPPHLDVLDFDHDFKLDGTGDIIRHLREGIGEHAPSVDALVAGKVPDLPSFPPVEAFTPAEGFMVALDESGAKKPMLTEALSSGFDAPARELSFEAVGSDPSKGIWAHLSTGGQAMLTELLADNAVIRATKDIVALQDPATGRQLDLPPAAMPPAWWKATGGPPKEPNIYLAGMSMSEAEANAARNTLAALSNWTPGQAPSEDYSYAARSGILGRLTEMVAAYDAVRKAAAEAALALPADGRPDGDLLEALAEKSPAVRYLVDKANLVHKKAQTTEEVDKQVIRPVADAVPKEAKSFLGTFSTSGGSRSSGTGFFE